MKKDKSMDVGKLISIISLNMATTLAFAQDAFTDYQNRRWKGMGTNMFSGWYESNETKEVADNVLIAQKEIGD